MSKKIAIIVLSVLAFMGVIQAAMATSKTTAALDKTAYLAGQTGYISATIYNDKSEKIRVTELSATVDYYYTDGTVYIQKFFTSAYLPKEIPAGESETFQIPISLPTNMAHGYTNPRVETHTDVWHPQDDRWMTSDHPTYSNLKLYIETPYKQAYEEEPGNQRQPDQHHEPTDMDRLDAQLRGEKLGKPREIVDRGGDHAEQCAEGQITRQRASPVRAAAWRRGESGLGPNPGSQGSQRQDRRERRQRERPFCEGWA